MSVSASTLTGPFNVAGATWTYAVTADNGDTNTLTETAVGPTTFNGQSVYELDSGVNSAIHTYVGIDGAGNYVTYGSVSQLGSGTVETVTYTQPGDGYPAELSFGAPATSNAAYTYVDVNPNPLLSSTTSYTDTQTVILVSDSTESITVPAGTYDAYHVHLSSTETDLTDIGSDISTTDADAYFVAGIGLVKLINHPTQNGGNSSPGFMYALTSFKGGNDHLDFIQNPLDSAAKDTIKPPVTVSIKDSQNNIDTSATGSVTLAIGSSTGNGTLTGTLTEPIVNGIATFPDLSINASGTYKLSANDTGTLSADFNITSGKLIYLQAPHDGTVNTSLNPGVIVEAVDSNGKLLTSSDGSTVTLQTIGFTGQAELTGNTATIESGKAVFPNLTFKQAGSYTLQAIDSNNDTFVNAGPLRSPATPSNLSRSPSLRLKRPDFRQQQSFCSASHKQHRTDRARPIGAISQLQNRKYKNGPEEFTASTTTAAQNSPSAITTFPHVSFSAISHVCGPQNAITAATPIPTNT